MLCIRRLLIFMRREMCREARRQVERHMRQRRAFAELHEAAVVGDVRCLAPRIALDNRGLAPPSATKMRTGTAGACAAGPSVRRSI